MHDDLRPDEELLRRLPLPVAQLLRRAHNAKSALERFQSSYYLWEASLKLLGSTAIIEFAARAEVDARIAERLQNLVRPSTGHWWEFVRLLIPALAEGEDSHFVAIRELLLGRARDDLPRLAGLDAELRTALEKSPGARSTVRLTELFDRLVQLRNQEIGHGAVGQRNAQFYRALGSSLLAGMVSLLERLDLLAGRSLIYVGDVRMQADRSVLVERYELRGETPRRLESLVIAGAETNSLPTPHQIYLQSPDVTGSNITDPELLHSLHPLVLFDEQTAEMLFLNSKKGKQQAEYLSYGSGSVVRRPELGRDQRELLVRILGQQVDDQSLADWAARSLAEEPADEFVGDVPSRRLVGEFELLSRIGRGGMGVVYRAWQPSLGRQVALKCSLRMGDAKSEARFAREIRALGRVEHPNLIKVFTSGADGDQWFYAMELVEGADLAAICQQLSAGNAPTRDAAQWQQAVSTACEKVRSSEETLSTDRELPSRVAPVADSAAQLTALRGGQSCVDQVVNIIRQVADAMHELHEAGIVHRDIKPGNIMVTSDGAHAVLMDLGLAQLADDVDGKLTRTRQFVGTLRYASPEQVLSIGKLDRRSDIYSLGATLWELLTLRPLFGVGDETPTPELMLKIQSADPGSARKVNSHVSPDLDAIVRKCLEKDPARRYETARELADDLGRYLRGEPVLAQPASLHYLLGKFVRRHRWPLAIAASVMTLLIGGAVAAFVQIAFERQQALAANKLLIEEQRESDEARREAEENLRVADERYSALDGVMRVFSSDALKGRQGGQEIRELVLSETISSLEKNLGTQSDSPGIKQQLAENLIELAELRKELGLYDAAISVYERAIRLRRQLLAASAEDPICLTGLADSLYSLAQCHFERPNAGGFAEVVAPCEESESIYRQLLGRYPDEPRFKAGLGRATVRRTSVDDLPDAEVCRQAILLMEEACEAGPADAMLLTSLANGWLVLGYTQSRQGDSDASRSSTQRARELAQQALKKNSSQTLAYRILSNATTNIAVELRNRGEFDLAEELLRSSIDDLQPFADRNEAAVKAQDAFLDIHRKRAWNFKAKRDIDRAVNSWEAVVDRCGLLCQHYPDHKLYVERRLEAALELSALETGRMQHERAAVGLDRLLKDADQLASRFAESPQIAQNLLQIANARAKIERDAGRHAESLAILKPAIERFAASAPKDDPAFNAATLEFLTAADWAVKAGKETADFDAAIPIGETALAWGSTLSATDDIDARLLLLGSMAAIYEAKGDLQAAIRANSEQYEGASPLLSEKPWHFFIHARYSGSAAKLPQLYRQTNEIEREFETLRLYFADSPYWDGQDTTLLLEETQGFSTANLERLRERFDKRKRAMKSFTVPCDFKGELYPFQVQIADSIQPFDDQVRWLWEVRGGKVPEAVIESFHRLYQIAKENNVSYQDLCVYALGMAASQATSQLKSERTASPTEIAKLKKQLEEATDIQVQRPLRQQLLQTHLELAKGPMGQKQYPAAISILADARAYFEPKSQDRRRDPTLRTIESEVIMQQAIAQTHAGQSQAAYEMLLAGLNDADCAAAPGDAWYGRYCAAIGHACRLLDRPIEAALWSWRAADQGEADGFQQLAEIYAEIPVSAQVLPTEFADLLHAINSSGDNTEEGLGNRLIAAWQKDPEKALQLRVKHHEARSRDLMQDGDYAAAESELRALVELEPRQVMRYLELANWQSQHNEWPEAVENLRKAFELTTPDKAPWHAALNFLEALVISNRPAEAVEVGDLLQRSGWKPDGTSDEVLARAAVYFALRAIAAHATGRDAATMESKVQRVTSTPAFRVKGWSWKELRTWLQSAPLEATIKERIASLLQRIETPDNEISCRYFPLAVGTAWSYTAGETSHTSNIESRVEVAYRACYRLATNEQGSLRQEQSVFVDTDGVYTHSIPGTGVVSPALKILPRAPEVGYTWNTTTQSREGDAIECSGRVLVVEDVTVPAGTYTDTVVVETTLQVNGTTTVHKTWYAEDVGPIKVEQRTDTIVTLELESVSTIRQGTWSSVPGQQTKSLMDLPFPDELLDELVVILLQGKNEQQEPIWAYVEMTVRAMKRLRSVMQEGGRFDPEDFGKVLAAGQNEPSAEVKQWLGRQYKTIESPHSPPVKSD